MGGIKLTIECDATALASDSYRVDSGRPRGKKMPLFPYLPVIVWMGMIQVVLGATGDITDASELTMNRGSIIPFPTPLSTSPLSAPSSAA